MDEVRAEPGALVRLAKTTLAAADDMTTAWSAAQEALAPPVTAFGNTEQAGRCATLTAQAEAAADDTWRVITGVYEGDVDRLYRVAFAYLQSDQEAADRQRTGGGIRGPL
ncbi:hypothetical protein [Actinoplanes sp. NPDC026619]|uniref:hypothetical protein n=1 Tax=Actinoplanes sp. NPDC026619 TaxID=3155798 RepID=UPI00340FC951